MKTEAEAFPSVLEYRPGTWRVSFLHPGGKVRRRAAVEADCQEEAEHLARYELSTGEIHPADWTDFRVQAHPDPAPEPADWRETWGFASG